jgi:hypothetical protein
LNLNLRNVDQFIEAEIEMKQIEVEIDLAYKELEQQEELERSMKNELQVYVDEPVETGCPHCGSYEGNWQECPECGHGQ